MARDGLDSKRAMERINSQIPIERKRELAKFVIDNSWALEKTYSCVDEMLTEYNENRSLTLLYWCLGFGPALVLYFLVWAIQTYKRMMVGLKRVKSN